MPPQRGHQALIALLVGAVLGWLMILAYASTEKDTRSVLGTGSMVAAASMLAGAFFGFLFGVPRTLQRPTEEDFASKKASESETQLSYRPNTNLEQISDWLTKILVGAGLTQISGIRRWVSDLSSSLAPGLGEPVKGRTFATAMIVCYALNGFLIGYLWTRLYLAGALAQADDIESLAREVKGIKLQSELDAKALQLAIKQMNPSPDDPPPNQQELNEALKDASQSIKAQVFYQALAKRQENWADIRRKATMERTIPIFRALIACDVDDAYHRNHGELGYALKDQRSPDWAGAETELSRAIELRGSFPGSGWIFYEMNRAICRIQLDENFKKGVPSSAEQRQKILDDLVRVANEGHAKAIAFSEATIQAWSALNQIDFQNLTNAME